MRLRTRLLVSYIVLISITLSVITLALLVFLNNRPAPRELTYRQLADFAQVHLRDLVGGVLRQANLETVVARLDEFSAEEGVRTLVVNTDSRSVIFDSAKLFAINDTLTLQVEASPPDVMLRPVIETLLRGRFERLFGSFTNPDAEEWLFFALVRVGGQPFALLFAEERPANTLGSILSVFRNDLMRPLVQAALIGLGIAVAMAYVVSRTIARPLQHIATAAAAVAQGDYEQRVPATGPPEVRAVAESFNHMSGEVRAAQDTQRDFLVNVSHDLKTPLTSIQGYSQAIMDGAADDPVEAATIIYEEAGRLNRMVVELTDLARLQSGQLSMQMHLLDISLIVQAVVQRLSIVAQKKGVALNVESPSMPHVSGDGDRLAQVVTNLLSNAVKYTPSGGSIAVKTQVNNGGVELTIHDTGVGIPAEDLPRIFERFYQVEKARGPRRGTGLGLAIVQEIVQAHAGTISVTSGGAGKGSTFTVWLPAPELKTVVRGKR
jgi:signal transduction histidine kinase